MKIMVDVKFKDGATFKGDIYLNPFNKKLVFDNNLGQEAINIKEIISIKQICEGCGESTTLMCKSCHDMADNSKFM